jgi:hypothetical protein
MNQTFSPRAMIENLDDLAELRVFTVEEAHSHLDALARRLGVVEVELVVGEEPEEGVEVELGRAHQLVGPVACIDGVRWGLCWRCEMRAVSDVDACDGPR